MPTYRSWLLIERFFALIINRDIRLDLFRSVRELIHHFVVHDNVNCKLDPDGAADSIVAKLERLYARISGIER